MNHNQRHDPVASHIEKRKAASRITALITVLCILAGGLTVHLTSKTAVTMERIPTCGVEEHVHTSECYAPVADHEEYAPVYETRRVFDLGVTPHVHSDA
ncbi:MAG: hypothetical protein IJ246_03365, partial [Clostridia bacterium]|nr:hypothetical protein [Clostridia bacterium]